MYRNIGPICSDCYNKRKSKFQETLTIEGLKRIQDLIKMRKKVFIKVAFGEKQDKKYDPEAQSYFYYNDYNESIEQKVEHMWVLCTDIDIESQSISGILNNDPYMIDLKCGDAVVSDFKHMQDIIYPETHLN